MRTQYQRSLGPCYRKKQNEAITLISLDVTAENSMKKVAAGIECKIDILVCNAGVLNGYGGVEDGAHHSQAISRFEVSASGRVA